MNNILTIENFLKAEYFDLTNENQTLKAKIAMKKAITAHVKAALEAAASSATYGRNHWDGIYVEKESILSAYPLEKII